MELTSNLAIARRWWWTLLVATWIAGLTGYLVATRIPPTYEARALLLVGPYEGDLNTLRASGQLTLTYAELVTVKPRLQSAIDQLGLKMSPAELSQATRVTANDIIRTLTIRVQNGSPKVAADLANTLSGLLTELVSQGTGRPEGELQVLAFADAPSSPIAPQVSVIAGLAALAGLLSALVLVVLIEYVSATIRGREDVSRLVPVPFLGQIEGGRSARAIRSLAVERLPASRMASSYRVVATKIAFADAEHPVRSLLLVSAQAGDGSGEMAANLAAALATSGRRTVLVDGDDAEGEASTLLGLNDLPGLAEIARGQYDLDDVIVKHEPHLHVVPVGRIALEVIDAQTIRSVLDRLLATHDLVIVAGPSVLGSAEALVYARSTDASVVVVRRDQTKRQALTYAVESLTLVGATILGVVLDARSGDRFGRRRDMRSQAPVELGPAAVSIGRDAASPAIRPRSGEVELDSPATARRTGPSDEGPLARPIRRPGRPRD